MPSVSTCTTPSAPHVYRLGDTKSNNILWMDSLPLDSCRRGGVLLMGAAQCFSDQSDRRPSCDALANTSPARGERGWC